MNRCRQMYTSVLYLLLLLIRQWSISLQEENLIARIHTQVKATQSSTWETWTADKGVDLNSNTNAGACDCCAGAHYHPSWWSVDLGNTYPIKSIIYIGRSNYQPQTIGFNMYKIVGRKSTLIYQNRESSGFRYTIDLDPPEIIQKINITHKSEAVSVCEIELIESQRCPAGGFGHNCEKHCYCGDKLPCERNSGVCQSTGCEAGWDGEACDTPCQEGNYGYPCRPCGKCLNDEICDRFSGTCPNGCKAGYMGDDCENACPAGTYGYGCNGTCGHCSTSKHCDPVIGSCSKGCQAGYTGIKCDTECSAGTYGHRCNETCGKCYETENCGHVAGKCPNGCQAGYTSTTCKTECPEGKYGLGCNETCGHCSKDDICYHVDGTCLDGCQTGYEGKKCITECSAGTYGLRCNETCGKCYENGVCGHVAGECHAGCQAGYTGTICKTECPEHKYGYGCNETCGHCFNDDICNHETGNCSGDCQAGYVGTKCKTECSAGTYGQRCNETCGKCFENDICDHVTGICSDGCQAGYTGTTCKTVCDEGTYGQNCSSLCHCFQEQPCNHTSGVCSSSLCASGWKGESCDKTCQTNTFGQNCSSLCHCAEGDVCHHETGFCSIGGCANGWKGKNCSIVAEPLKKPDDGTSTGVIAGVISGIVVILVIVALFAIYWKRIRPGKSETNFQEFSDKGLKGTADEEVGKHLSDSKNQRKTNSEKETVQVDGDRLYYSFATNADKIQVNQLWEYMNLAHQSECVKLQNAFQTLPSGLVHSCDEGRRPENAKKNRYREMFAYDHSRVVLRRRDENSSTYINACYIDGFDRPRKFIASQGPTEYMAGDFWEMVIQEQSSVIVMLTNIVEGGKRKCIQYWPTEEKEEQTFGEVKVTTSKIKKFPDYIIRELDINKTADANPIRITQLHFTAWPDKDVPDVAWHLVNFWRTVNSIAGSKKEPIIIHCSAGVGRTGTFIGLDNLHTQAKAHGYILPLEIVTELRQQRVNMVQTKAQYVFLHEALADAFYIGVKPVKTNEFEAVYTLLLQTDKDTGKAGLETQFRLAQETGPTTSNENVYSNAAETKEWDEYRPKEMASASLSRRNESDISFIQNYAGKDTVILSTIPYGDELETLLKTLAKHNVKTVITFRDNAENKGKVNRKGKHGQHDSKEDNHHLEHLESVQDKHYLVETYANKDSRNVKQFVFLAWKESHASPPDSQSVIALLNAVQRWQPEINEAQPVLIYDECGFARSGPICLLLAEFERVRMKQEANILATLKQMKSRNPQLMQDYESYKFCYTAVLDYIRQSDVYMNA